MNLRDALLPVVLLSASAPVRGDDRLGAHMTIAGITLEETTLEDARLLLGPAEVRHNGGDAAASTWGACYQGADGTTLALLSSDEMGGGTTLTDFQLVAPGEEPDFSTYDDYAVPPDLRPICGELGSLSRATATEGGLRLGMTIAEVRGLLGTPVDQDERSLLFTTVDEAPTRSEREEPYTLWRSLRVEFAGGVVTAIRATQVTSG
jgi:hypothetical protein